MKGAHQPASRTAGHPRNPHCERNRAVLKDMRFIWRMTSRLITATLLCVILMSGWLLVIEHPKPSFTTAEQSAERVNKDSGNPSE